MTLLLTVFPYGRQQGIGSAFAFPAGRPWLATGLALMLTAAARILALGLGRWESRFLVVVSAAFRYWLGWWASSRLDGEVDRRLLWRDQ